MSTIESDPGITKSELTDELGLAWGTIDYHVHRLQKDQLIQSWYEPPRVHLFDRGIPERMHRGLSVLRRKHGLRVLGAIESESFPSMQALAKQLGLSRKVIGRTLHHLGDAGLVSSKRDGSLEPHGNWQRTKAWLRDFVPR